jgi:2-polyprenyl-3-methyl-5-hydroxy-6-metoxy-1,4-benzoquinol methylase
MHLEGASVRGVPASPVKALSAVPAEPAGSRYDVPLELDPGSSHGAVLQLVGSGRRVLDLGCAGGGLARGLTAAGNSVVGVDADPDAASRAAAGCERAVVADLDDGWPAELDDERFDVVVAADVLEHLRDPSELLASVRPHLLPGGYVVATVPNVAHASVRLALLQGRFPYGDVGLLDRTHLRFYSRETLRELFADAGLGVVLLQSLEKPLEASEVPFDPAAVPAEVLAALADDPDARAYQFVVAAHPVPELAPAELSHRVHRVLDDLEEAQVSAAAERARAAELEERLAVVERETAELLAAREHEMRERTAAHDRELRERLAARDREVDELQAGLGDLQRRHAALGAEHLQLRALAREAHEHADTMEARAVAAAHDAEALRPRAAERDDLAARVERMRATRAWRAACAWWRLGELAGRRG